MAQVQWTGDVIIAEDATSMDEANNWVANNTPMHADTGIDLTEVGTEGTDYIIPEITKIGIVEAEEIKVTKIAGRTNFKIGTGAGNCVVTMTALCIDDQNANYPSAEQKVNNILSFIRRHDKMSDTAIYLVVSRDHSGTRRYIQFVTAADASYTANYMQCTLTSGKPKWISYGVWEIAIQCEEVNT